jgi:membrane protease YdiL (CAAX protease family)
MNISVAKHLAWVERQHILLSSLLLALYSMLGRIVVVLVSSPALLLVSPDHLLVTDEAVPWYFPLIVAPVLETLLFQWAPISLMAHLKLGLLIQIAVSTALFSLMHLSSGLLAVLSAIPSGLILAYTWTQWRKRSFSQAFAATGITHFWINCLVFAFRIFGT